MTESTTSAFQLTKVFNKQTRLNDIFWGQSCEFFLLLQLFSGTSFLRNCFPLSFSFAPLLFLCFFRSRNWLIYMKFGGLESNNVAVAALAVMLFTNIASQCGAFMSLVPWIPCSWISKVAHHFCSIKHPCSSVILQT